MSKTIQLGDIARDKITGFEGVVVSEHKWLHGCRRLGVQPTTLDKDGKVQEAHTFDEPQLELVTSQVAKGTSDKGGPRPEARRPEPNRGR